MHILAQQVNLGVYLLHQKSIFRMKISGKSGKNSVDSGVSVIISPAMGALILKTFVRLEKQCLEFSHSEVNTISKKTDTAVIFHDFSWFFDFGRQKILEKKEGFCNFLMSI